MDDSAAEDELSVLASARTGWFRFYFDDQRWEWSPQVQQMHGYEPGAVTPTTELVLSHKHPEDRDAVAATIDRITHTRGAFSGRHRIVDTAGIVHWVVVVGDQFADDAGDVIGTHGFYVDVTPAAQAREDMVTERVGEIAGSRAPIEQVKGMLMLIYDVDDDVAFGLLKWLSQETNTKLRSLAEKIAPALRGAARGVILDRTTFDHTLITAHRRPTKPI